MKDPRKEKIGTLKSKIKEEEDNQLKIITDFDLKSTKELPEEERKKVKTEWQHKIQIKKVEIDNLKEELKQTRMNKHSSSFFEFTPTLANRRMRRTARKMRRK